MNSLFLTFNTLFNSHITFTFYLKKSFFYVFLFLFLFKINLFAETNLQTKNEVPSTKDITENFLDNHLTSRRSTEFEWDSIQDAKSYEIEITPVDRKDGVSTPFSFITEKPIWNGELKPGKYTMRLRSRDKRDVPGDWSRDESFYVKLYAPSPLSPLENETLQTKETENYNLKLKWKEQSQASRYVIHIEDESKNFQKDIETSQFEVSIVVPVAKKYRWHIKGYDKEGNEGEPIEGDIPFTVLGKKLTTPKINYPETAYIRQLSWNNVDFAESYSYEILIRGDRRQWVKIKEDQISDKQINFDPQWKGGKYKFILKAHSYLRENSNSYAITFDVANGARTPEAEKFALLRKSIDRTNDWYFVASYLITQITYSSVNWDQGSRSQFQGLGGTGRLGIGFLDKNSPYGFLGILDYSGFIIGSKNYKYPSAELHGIYRWVSQNAGEFRASFGFYYKELPEIISSTQDSSIYSISQNKALGAHVGGEYWFPINSRLGLQANGRMYIPFLGKASNGKSISIEPSYQFGLMGSLRLNTKTTGLAGMAYRKDIIKYKVSDASALSEGHQFNNSSVVGTYLNFYLEWDI